MSHAAIEMAWIADQSAFKLLIHEHGQHVQRTGFEFAFCDVIANFYERAVVITKDADVLVDAIMTLVELGHSHNRWHVQSVLIRMLQEIRDAPTALTAAAALQDCKSVAVNWTVTDFASRSLHPALRRAVDEMADRLVSPEGST